ncbi:Type 1 glutamine amidotransferase-like domain-containing protein [Catenuloplanes sp. NPDC051500]|uniref:Type 1 glutamine amidotransferase-like domain-containing protein n=1 Tax=Catenuloplanes sp. NPDC051500 TaxID=3363959 RepID=UPI0037959BCD
MAADEPTILATSMVFRGSGAGPYDWAAGPVYRYAAELAKTGGRRPKLCFLGQADGDNLSTRAAFYAAITAEGFEVSHLALFPMPNHRDVRKHLLGQDVIWVGGGSVANMVAVWRVHDLPEILHEAWQAGVVMGGVSAGSICWTRGGTTDSYGRDLRAFTDGLGWLPYANGVHYDAEEQRRPLMHRLMREGVLAPHGYATDNGAGLVFRGTTLAEAIVDREGAGAYELRRTDTGDVTETPLPVTRI